MSTQTSENRPTARYSVLSSAKEIADTLRETAIERDLKGGTALAERQLLRESGLLNTIIPTALGGLGEDWKTMLQIVRLFSQVDSSIGHLYGFQHLILATIDLFGTEKQRDHYYKKTVDEKLFWGNALNPLDKGTTAVIDTDGNYRFNGKKGFSSGSSDSDMLLVSGFLNDKITIGMTPSAAEGIDIKNDWNNFGQRQTDSGTVIFDNLILKKEQILLDPGPLGNVQATLRSCLAQLILIYIYIGIAEGALQEAKNYTVVQTRAWHTAGVNTPQEDPYILANYGNLWLSLQTSLSLAKQAAETFQQQWNMHDKITIKQRGKVALDIALAKVQAIRTGLEITNKMFDVTGSRATNGSARLDRYWRNLRTHSLHDPVDYKIKELGEWFLNDKIPEPGFYS